MAWEQQWDFGDPAGSRERFVSALAEAGGDEALVLRTQVARAYGLEGDFDRARQELAEIERLLDGAGAEPRVRHRLELGRTYVSAAHDPERVTDADREIALEAFGAAAGLAADAGLDGLRVDALHMAAMVPLDRDVRIAKTREALAAAEVSAQAAGRRWRPALLNNLGYELAGAGRHDEGDEVLRAALEERRAGTDEEATRVARWMVAWNLRLAGDHATALQMQQRLRVDCEAAGAPDPYVDEEIGLLRAALGGQPDGQRDGDQGPG